MTTATYRVLVGDALEQLRTLPEGSVHCVVTSPPYWRLRSYLDAGHPDKAKELGQESTPGEYVTRLVALFQEVKRVLRSDGTCWVNLGDTRSGSGRGASATPSDGTKEVYVPHPQETRGTNDDRPPKNLLMIPARFALAMQDDGWILRSKIVWHKPNSMPSSVADRPSDSYEEVLLFSRAPHYYYDADAIAEAAIGDHARNVHDQYQAPGQPRHRGLHKADKQSELGKRQYTGFNARWDAQEDVPKTRNRRNVWTVATEAFAEAHFATFPQKLVEPMILAGAPATVCVRCGTPRQRLTRTRYVPSPAHGAGSITGRRDGGDGLSHYHGMPRVNAVHDTTGWTDCGCNAGWDAGTVLDPFAGSGTTLAVANRLGRHAIGIELNPDYLPLIERRCAQPGFIFAEVTP